METLACAGCWCLGLGRLCSPVPHLGAELVHAHVQCWCQGGCQCRPVGKGRPVTCLFRDQFGGLVCAPPRPHKFLLGAKFLSNDCLRAAGRSLHPGRHGAWTAGGSPGPACPSLFRPIGCKGLVWGSPLCCLGFTCLPIHWGTDRAIKPQQKAQRRHKSKIVVWGLRDFEARKVQGTHPLAAC